MNIQFMKDIGKIINHQAEVEYYIQMVPTMMEIGFAVNMMAMGSFVVKS